MHKDFIDIQELIKKPEKFFSSEYDKFFLGKIFTNLCSKEIGCDFENTQNYEKECYLSLYTEKSREESLIDASLCRKFGFNFYQFVIHEKLIDKMKKYKGKSSFNEYFSEGKTFINLVCDFKRKYRNSQEPFGYIKELSEEQIYFTKSYFESETKFIYKNVLKMYFGFSDIKKEHYDLFENKEEFENILKKSLKDFNHSFNRYYQDKKSENYTNKVIKLFSKIKGWWK